MPSLTRLPPRRRNRPGAGRPRKFSDEDLRRFIGVAIDKGFKRSWVAKQLGTTPECVYLHCRRLDLKLPDMRKKGYGDRAQKIWDEFIGKRTTGQLARRFKTTLPVIRSALWYMARKFARFAPRTAPRRMSEIKLFKTIWEYKPAHLKPEDLQTLTGVPLKTCEAYVKRCNGTRSNECQAR